MLKILLERSKVIAKQLVVAFFFTTFIVFLIAILFGNRVEKFMAKANKLATISYIESGNSENIKLEKKKKRLINYPNFGDSFGRIKIESVGIDMTLYHGETLDILKYGAGHHAGSYFPGEGGTIIVAGHNRRNYFHELPKVKIGDIVTIETSYGTYEYAVTKTEIANAYELGHNLKLSDEEETVMLYTCYPVDALGIPANRYVVYASLVGETHE